MISKKRADVMNAVMDQSAIGAAATPPPDRPKAPTLAGAQRPVPMAQPAPIAPRIGFGGPSGPTPAFTPGGKTPPPRVDLGARLGASAAQGGVVGSDRGPVRGIGNIPGGVPGAVAGGEGSGDFGSGTPKPAPTAPQQTPKQDAQSEQDRMDQEIRDFVRSRIGAAGNVDTTEEEALITRQMEGKLGEGLVDARARGGRAGFGMSGAQQAVEGDVRGAASRSALDQILGLRRGEEQRAIENATSAIGTEQGMRSAASADALRRMVLESLQAEAGLDGPAEGPTTILPADENKDGTVSVQEQQRHQQGTVEPQLEGRQKSQEFFAGGGNAASLPQQPVGGDVIMLSPPTVDVDGNERPGITYNTKTKTLGRA